MEDGLPVVWRMVPPPSRQPLAGPHHQSPSTGTLPPPALSGPCASSSGPGGPSAGSSPDTSSSTLSRQRIKIKYNESVCLKFVFYNIFPVL